MATASSQLGASPAAAYSWRPPSPPHIHVPQAPEDKPLILEQYHEFESDSAEDREVLDTLTQGKHIAVHSQEWKYEWRRSAQSILSFLYLGPSAAARDIDYLKREGITLLLVIRDTLMAGMLSGEKAANALGIEAASIDVAGNQQLIQAFPAAVKTINNHLVSMFHRNKALGKDPAEYQSPAKVLVFCESGNERSASVVAAYLMQMYNIDTIRALQYIQHQRFCIAFDDSLKNLLASYHSLLEAKRSVGFPSDSSTAPQTSSPRKTKRSRDDMDVDDEEIEAGQQQLDDEERFGKRSAFTPFH